MRFLSFLSVLLFSINSFAYYQNKLTISDPKCLALGKTTINSDQVFNPAISILYRNPNLYISYMNLYQQKELGKWNCSFVYPNNYFHSTINIEKFGYEHYGEIAISYGMAKRLSSKFALGYQLHLHDFYYTGCEEQQVIISADVGTLYIPTRKFTFCFWLQSLICKELNAIDEQLSDFPIVGLFSSKIAITDNSEWTLEITNRELKDWSIRSGIEYRLENFRIRCGCFTQPISPSLGIGFKAHDFSLDVASLFHKQLGYSLSVGIGKTF